MRKSTVVQTLFGTVVAAVLLVAVLVIFAANSYVGCASRLLSGAPPADVFPPATYRRLAVPFWGHRDLFLARVLARECAADSRGGIGRFDRQVLALGAVKTLIDWPQRVTLSAVFMPVPGGGRGLTRASLAEWGRPPADLDESEMTWLFVVSQQPDCSKHRVAEKDRDACASLYQSLLDKLPRPSSPS